MSLFLLACTIMLATRLVQLDKGAWATPGADLETFASAGASACMQNCIRSATALHSHDGGVTFCESFCSPFKDAQESRENDENDSDEGLLAANSEDKAAIEFMDAVEATYADIPTEVPEPAELGSQEDRREADVIGELEDEHVEQKDEHEEQEDDHEKHTAMPQEILTSAKHRNAPLQPSSLESAPARGPDSDAGRLPQEAAESSAQPALSATTQESASAPASGPQPAEAAQASGERLGTDFRAGGEESGLTAYQEELDNDAKLLLWLRADRGVQTGPNGTVQTWSDPTRKVSFFPTPPESHFHEFFGHEDHASARGEPLLNFDKLHKLPLVEFPCALETKDVKLGDEATLFFVLRPEAFLFGRSARGQRFFGHYPQGQFRFADASPSFFSGTDRKLTRHALDSEIRAENGLILLKYKLEGKRGVWVGVNRDPMFRVSKHPVQISKDSRLSVGGVAGGCGFRGGIAEVIAFRGALESSEMLAVESYLEQRWWADLSLPMKSVMREVNGDEDRLEVASPAPAEHAPEPGITELAGAAEQPSCDSSRDEALLEFVNERAAVLKPVLWLEAGQDLTTAPESSQVVQWESHLPGKAITFSTPAHDRDLPRLRAAANDACLSFVEFGCAMTAPAVQLAAPMTAYVVLRRSASSPETTHQRVFGHFPNGGFIFDGQKPGFKSKHGFLFAKSSTKKHLRGDAPTGAPPPGRSGGEFVILKYRLGEQSGVEVGSAKADFVPVGAHHDLLFSTNKKLSLGGTNGGCEFTGGIGELLTFGTALSDADDRTVTQALAKKWLHMAADDDNDAPQLVPESERCVDYAVHDTAGVLDWKPSGAFVSKEQFEEWRKLVHKHSLQVANAPPGKQRSMERSIRAELAAHRLRIFGEPCANRRPGGVSQQIVAQSEPTSAEKSTKAQAVSNAEVAGPSEVAIESAAASSGGCTGVKRAFSNAILDWKMPSSADTKAKYAWEDATDKVRSEISHMTTGGTALLNFLKTQSRYLNDLRDTLFANVCDDEGDSSAATKEDKHVQEAEVAPSARCDTTVDILSWKAPSGVPIEDARAWADAVDQANADIQAFQQGGKALEAFLKTLVRGLRDKRSSLFGQLCGPLP